MHTTINKERCEVTLQGCEKDSDIEKELVSQISGHARNLGTAQCDEELILSKETDDEVADSVRQARIPHQSQTLKVCLLN